MKIGLLMAGESAGDLAIKYGLHEKQFIDLFEPLHAANSPKIEWKIYYVLNDIFPVSADECDAYLVTGSKHGVYDNLPWMIKLSEFIRQIVSAKKRLTGVCFGHQIIAHALGGKVVKVEQGFGIGMHEYNMVIPPEIAHLAQHDDFALKTTFKVNVMHGDQVVELPPTAEIIAASDFCQFAGLYYPEGVLTYQGHPEFDNQFIRDLITDKWNRGQDWVETNIKDQAIDSSADNQPSTRLPIAQFMLNFMTEKTV
ncbi:MAG: type 1 glutamine amidotransferase [Alphaproteobacteria bacterium]|nr:type 1 glutamine amidotransferase [Alphaproteobacteria bacterium]